MTELALIEASVVSSRNNLEALADAMRGLSSLGELHEVRARIEAVRAWAKVHKQIRTVRLDLLRAEIAALVRVVQLGGLDDLPLKDREAATYLASRTEDEVAELIGSAATTCTTATGLVGAVWNADELDKLRKAQRARGIALVKTPTRPPLSDEAIEEAARYVSQVPAVLKQLMDDYTEIGAPFTVAEMAQEVIEQAGIGDRVGGDEALVEGVREMCRRSIRSSPTLHLGQTILPRMVTVRTADGFIRIPTEQATMWHFDDMRALRRQQLEQDTAALDRLDEISQRLRAIPGCEDDAQIGDLIASSLEVGGDRPTDIRSSSDRRSA